MPAMHTGSRAVACYFLVASACALPAPRLRIGEVKQRLARFGVSTAGIVEADALRVS